MRTTFFLLEDSQLSHARNIKFLRPPSFFYSHSNSCTLARPLVYRRCLYTGARCMGKLALSAAWPETLIAPGTAQSAPDTFLRPRGRRTHTPNKSLTFIYPRRGLLSLYASFQQHPAFVSNAVTCSHTWELSVHLQFAVAIGFKRFAQGHLNTQLCFSDLRPPLAY